MDGQRPASRPHLRFAGWLLALATFVGAPIQADLPAAPARVEEGLARLVDDALAANLELRAGSATVEQRLAALDQARARYLPLIDFAARYSVADGGRTIDFPAADLLNPVYERLDQMLVADGQSPRFPRVANQEIELLRPHEQETKLVLEQPIYEPRLAPGVEAGRQELSRAEADLSALRARVVRDMRQAYYQWLAAQQAVIVLQATLELAQANLDANSSLYRNGRITRDLVYRAEADVLEVEQQRLFAASRVRLSQSYVNLLRDAPLETPLPESEIDPATIDRFRTRFARRLAGRPAELAELQALAVDERAELAGLDAAVAAGEAQQDLARAAFKPRLALGAEAGIQGEVYGTSEEDQYVLATLVLRWNAFRGGADRAALREARALTEEFRAIRDLAAQQVRLDVQRALEDLGVAEATLETAAKRADAAEGAFRIVSRKRDLGQINQAEFIDSRRALTDARLNLTRVRAEYLARLAELEYAVGGTRALGEEPAS